MGRLTVEQIISVDGYAADANGGIEFFEAVAEVDSNDADQLEFLKDVDAILLGATTYRLFAGYWPTADPATDRVASPCSRRSGTRRAAGSSGRCCACGVPASGAAGQVPSPYGVV